MTNETKEQSFRSTFGSDFLASVVVFLVALPLCMGIAIASGVPPAIGLITGLVGGLVVGLISGSPLQVSGPAAGLSVLVFETVQQHGVAMLGVIVLLAGIMQMTAGALRLGQWFRAISPAVIQGMLAGIGALIVASQIHVVVDDVPRSSGLANLLSIPEAIMKGIFPVDGSSHHYAAAIGLLTIVIMVVWSQVKGKLKLVPGPLVAVTIATLVTLATGFPIKTVSVPDNLASVVTLPTLESFLGLNAAIVGSALALAIIASAETLLSATAVDRMHTGPRTQYNRELFAQGVGNTICGALGALPMTGVIVRSSANVQAGGKTRASAVMHGIWLLGLVALLPWVLNVIPTTSLAAVLVYTGFKLLSPVAVRELSKFGRAEVAIYAVTVVAIVATNLLEGVLIGLGLALAKLIWTFTHLQTTVQLDQSGDETVVAIAGSATFVRLPQLAQILDAIPPGAKVRMDVSKLVHIDHACLDLITGWRKQLVASGGTLDVDWNLLISKHHGPPFEGVVSEIKAQAANRRAMAARTSGQ